MAPALRLSDAKGVYHAPGRASREKEAYCGGGKGIEEGWGIGAMELKSRSCGFSPSIHHEGHEEHEGVGEQV